MTWGVWCSRSGGKLSPAFAWLREGGEEWTTATEQEATVKAQETNLSAYETFSTAGQANPLTYRARQRQED